QYSALAEPLNAAVMRVVEQQRFILGPEVDGLEGAVREYLEVKHAVGCASGTDALLLSFRALDIGPGDEVITTPFTFFATAGAIHNVGARPIFADIEPDTFNLDPAAADAAIGPPLRAVIPVHLFGQMAPMETLRWLANAGNIGLNADRGCTGDRPDRGCRAGHRRPSAPSRRTRNHDWYARRHLRPILLPDEEPGGVRRRRNDAHQRRPACRAALPAPRSWRQADVPP